MTSRWLKDDDNNLILGKNGKKLRYLFYKKTGSVQTTFDSNWQESSIEILEKRYPEKVERINKVRGRPKKEIIKKDKKVNRIKVTRLQEKKLKNTAAAVDTSDEEEMYEIEAYQIVKERGISCYKNKQDWLFDQVTEDFE